MAILSRFKNWVSGEVLTAADLNAEFNNIVNNLTASNVEGGSANVTAMRVTQDPGEVGTEVLAASVLEEIRQLRRILVEITGKTYWYQTPVSSLEGFLNGTGQVDVIADNIVSAAKLQTNSVTTVKIADLNVTTAKIALLAVSTAQLADASITTAKLQDASVSTNKIINLNVTSQKIADNAVTHNKKDRTLNTSASGTLAFSTTSTTFVDTGIAAAFIPTSGLAASTVMISLSGEDSGIGYLDYTVGGEIKIIYYRTDTLAVFREKTFRFGTLSSIGTTQYFPLNFSFMTPFNSTSVTQEVKVQLRSLNGTNVTLNGYDLRIELSR